MTVGSMEKKINTSDWVSLLPMSGTRLVTHTKAGLLLISDLIEGTSVSLMHFYLSRHKKYEEGQ